MEAEHISLNDRHNGNICSASIVSPREPYITPRATSPRGDIGRRLIRHVIQIFTCNVHYISYISTMPLIIHVFYEQILNLEIFLNCEKKFYEILENFEILKFFGYTNITCENLYHMPYQPSTYITPRAGGPWGDIGFSGWYGMWYKSWHVIFSIYCTRPYCIANPYWTRRLRRLVPYGFSIQIQTRTISFHIVHNTIITY
jgi:hypothetical protein